MTAAANGGEVADIDAALDDGDEVVATLVAMARGRLVRLVGAMVFGILYFVFLVDACVWREGER